mmetsp:Transcript_7283/g.22802  ORF Transcript_7283/g.22802 Transcript_7283/m.22802 type:complete len:226 (-) Transcript_7283:142-819(-)
MASDHVPSVRPGSSRSGPHRCAGRHSFPGGEPAQLPRVRSQAHDSRDGAGAVPGRPHPRTRVCPLVPRWACLPKLPGAGRRQRRRAGAAARPADRLVRQAPPRRGDGTRAPRRCRRRTAIVARQERLHRRRPRAARPHHQGARGLDRCRAHGAGRRDVRRRAAGYRGDASASPRRHSDAGVYRRCADGGLLRRRSGVLGVAGARDARSGLRRHTARRRCGRAPPT